MSALIFGHALNEPLYGADCSAAACEYLAAGNVEAAIGEWRRLAALGSGKARCVLAYVTFRGAPAVAADAEEAKKLAVSAMASDRGYANYLLGCFALKERQPQDAVNYFTESIKAAFEPAFTMLGSLIIGGKATGERKSQALSLLRRAIASGHLPARFALVRHYLAGRFGLARRVLGIFLLPWALKYLWVVRYQGFSIHCFHFFLTPRSSLFTESPRAARAPYLWLLLSAHLIAAAIAIVVLLNRPGGAPLESRSNASVLAWAALAAWPYALSYFFASANVARSGIATAVHLLLLYTMTIVACAAYAGRLFDSPLDGWWIAIGTISQASALVFASGVGTAIAKQFVPMDVPAPAYRAPILWAHVILGLVAAGSWFARPEVSSLEHAEPWPDWMLKAMLAALPYLASAAFCWRLVTANRWKPWAYIAVLLAGTAMGVVDYSGIFEWQPGFVGQWIVITVQLLGFYVAAEWALDGTLEDKQAEG